MASSINIELVDSISKATRAIDQLRHMEKFSVDCEGVDLGRHGELCLLQIATTKLVYIFDIVTLGSEVFNLGLRDVLEDPSISKLFYDCREDCNALKHQYNVNVQGIEDLQLLDTIGKKIAGKRSEFVNGLRKSLSYHLPGVGFSGLEKEKMHQAFDADKELWKKRPLKPEYLSYAAGDVFYLARLEAKLSANVIHLFGPDMLKQIVQYASSRYADFMRNNDKYGDSKYFRHPRLPLNIIPTMTPRGGKIRYENIIESGTRCTACNQYTGGTRLKCSRCLAIDSDQRR